MYTKKVYKIKDMALWTRYETFGFLVYITAWTALYTFFDLEWLMIPWTPMALIGTAVAFVIGFQNNSVYGRIWEARKIWGGIVNTSRTFGVFVKDMVKDTDGHPAEKEIKTLTYRHIAWMTALRYAMREGKLWETTSQHRTNTEWGIVPPEKESDLEENLKPYLSPGELKYILSKSNKQTALLNLQSKHLTELEQRGAIWEFSFLELENVIKELFTLQGQTERIKNFPYPRQYATLNQYFMWLLIFLLPVALVPQFIEIGKSIPAESPFISQWFPWLSVPIYTAVAWIFHTMERIGRTGENPFEGTANDVPISTIARGIEIDLRQNLDEDPESIPKQFDTPYDIQF